MSEDKSKKDTESKTKVWKGGQTDKPLNVKKPPPPPAPPKSENKG